jgi:hypothetical protein
MSQRYLITFSNTISDSTALTTVFNSVTDKSIQDMSKDIAIAKKTIINLIGDISLRELFSSMSLSLCNR